MSLTDALREYSGGFAFIKADGEVVTVSWMLLRDILRELFKEDLEIVGDVAKEA